MAPVLSTVDACSHLMDAPPVHLSNRVKQTVEYIKDIVPFGGLSVWTGDGRLGKTTAASLTVDEVNASYQPDDPNSYRAMRVQVAGEPAGVCPAGRRTRRGIRIVWEGAEEGPMSNSMAQDYTPETLTRLTVEKLVENRIRLIFIDEAGLLHIEEIRGMAQVYDHALRVGFPLTIVFVGNDGLAEKMQSLSQVRGRVVQWARFEAYGRGDVQKLLTVLAPEFAVLDQSADSTARILDLVAKYSGGKPGRVVQMLQDLAIVRRRAGGSLVLTEELLTRYIDMKQAAEDSMTATRRPARRLSIAPR